MSRHERDPYGDDSAWWGPVWARRSPRSLLELMTAGVVDTKTAAFLSAHLARRGSLVVVAGPSGAGKTTLVTALAGLLPAAERRIYLRGVYEPFAFLNDSDIIPERSVLMVNEISPHLPIYLWGPAARRTLGCAALGFRILATAHAEAAREVVGLLAGYPLRLGAAEIAALEMAVVVRAWRDGDEVRRRIVEVTGLGASERGGVTLRPILRPGDETIDDASAVAWLADRGGSATDAARDLAAQAAAFERVP